MAGPMMSKERVTASMLPVTGGGKLNRSPQPIMQGPGAMFSVPGGKNGSHTGGGPLGNLMGWNGVPLYDGIHRFLQSPQMQDIGFGLMSQPNISKAIAFAGERGAQMAPYRAEEEQRQAEIKKQAELVKKYGSILADMGPEYADLADAVSVGAINPGEGYITAFARKREMTLKAEELRKSVANAAFLKDPTLKQMVASGALPFKEAYAVEQGQKPTDDIQEFMFAQEQGFEGDFLEFKARQGASDGGGYGQTVMLGQGPDGPVPLRADPNGGLSVAPMPEGITFDPGGIAGARTTATVDAKTAGAARSALPGAELGYEIASKAIADILGDSQGQAENFGSTLFVPNQMTWTAPGTKKANFWNQVEQLSGQAFLQIRQALKGAGQVTDYEGMKGEQALSRARKAAESGDQEAFQTAVIDFKAAIDRGMELLREQAGGGYVEGAPAVQSGTPGGLAAPQIAVNPQTGERLVLQDGQWVPMQ